MLNQEFDKSLELLNIAVNYCGDSLSNLKATALANIGIINAIKGNYREAETFYNNSEKIAKKENYKYILQIIYTNKAHLALHLKDYDYAMTNYEYALKFQVELGQYKPMIASLKGIGDIYLSKKNFAKATVFFNKADSVALRYKLYEELSDILLSKANLYEEIADFSNAYKNFKKHYQIKDSINQINVRKQIAAIEASFELDRKQAEIEILKVKEYANQQEIDRQKKIIILMVIGSAIILGLLIFSLIQKKQKLQAYNRLLSINLKSMLEEESNDNPETKNIIPNTNIPTDDDSYEFT